MKVVIFAGGLGTRISEETDARPKPMVEIGGKPILWHIMKMYSQNGFNEFIICLGYKGYVIKEGMQIVVGTSTSTTAPTTDASKNPLQPQTQGAGRRGGPQGPF